MDEPTQRRPDEPVIVADHRLVPLVPRHLDVLLPRGPDTACGWGTWSEGRALRWSEWLPDQRTCSHHIGGALQLGRADIDRFLAAEDAADASCAWALERLADGAAVGLVFYAIDSTANAVRRPPSERMYLRIAFLGRGEHFELAWYTLDQIPPRGTIRLFCSTLAAQAAGALASGSRASSVLAGLFAFLSLQMTPHWALTCSLDALDFPVPLASEIPANLDALRRGEGEWHPLLEVAHRAHLRRRR